MKEGDINNYTRKKGVNQDCEGQTRTYRYLFFRHTNSGFFQKGFEEAYCLMVKENNTFSLCKYVPLSQHITGRVPWVTTVLDGCKAV